MPTISIQDIIYLVKEVGWPLGKKLVDLWANKKEVTAAEWLELSKPLDKTYDDYLNEAAAAATGATPPV